MKITFTVLKTKTGNYYLYNNKVVSLEPQIGAHKGLVIGTQHFKEEFGVSPTYETEISDYLVDVREITSIEQVTMPVILT